MRLRVIGFTFVILFTLTRAFAVDICQQWFNKLGVSSESSGCDMTCAMADVNMGTFDCPTRCKDFCSKKSKTLLDNVSYANKFCPAEKNLIEDYPLRAKQVQDAEELALDTTAKIFGYNHANDESDAFRHCLWSSLIFMHLAIDRATNKIEPEAAKEWLNAHESCSDDRKGSEMDYQNNEFGINMARNQFKLNRDITFSNLVTGCFQATKEKKLIIHSPRRMPNELPKIY